MKISVIFVTNRKGYEDILVDDMKRQTFKDFELIVADDNCEPQNQTHNYFKPRLRIADDVWNINKAYNDAIARASGDLLVFLQDFIWIPANGLQRFWDMYTFFPDAMITGVGHKAKHELEGISEVDDRVNGEPSFAPGNFSHWELNWSSCPRRKMAKFNEEMDRFYGGENQYVAKKSGLQVYIDRENRCIGYSQAECGGRPENWEAKHSNKGALAGFLDSIVL